MKMKNIILTIAVAIIFTACEETIELDLTQTPPELVIEGLVTNREGMQSVKVTWTTDFYATGTTPRVTDATVTVKDDLGNTFVFVHNPRSVADSMGIYIPQDDFVGAIGRTYTLTVVVGNTTITAEDDLVPVIPIDSLGYRITTLEWELDDPKEEGKIYEALLFATEPQDQTNYYLFKFYRNDSLKYYNDTDIYYSDDKFLAENINGFPSPVYYGLGDTGKVEVYSISREGYVYYYDLWSLLNNDAGGMFGPIPASPRTNLSNGTLGFFQVSAVNSSTLLIE